MSAIIKRVIAWLQDNLFYPAMERFSDARQQLLRTVRAAAAFWRGLSKKNKRMLIAAAAVFVLAAAAALIYEPDGIAMPKSSYEFMHGDFKSAEQELRAAGFSHIETVKEFHDAQWNNMWASSGDVVSVKIRGKEVAGGRNYPEDSVIVITYYAFE